ncbi:hypothetical protein [Pseudocolwellia agarivorans]|uniref:hypothetical protein n=1 Tax=Pseudocolwellia agarivorans TaxID=1911682 RepID=UPI003F8831B3
MKYLVFITLVFTCFQSLALSCDTEMTKLTEKLNIDKDRNNKEIKRLADALVEKGKAKSTINLIYKLQYSDSDVSPINKEAQKEAFNFISILKTKDCEAIIKSFTSLGNLENKRANLMIQKLKAMKN